MNELAEFTRKLTDAQADVRAAEAALLAASRHHAEMVIAVRVAAHEYTEALAAAKAGGLAEVKTA